MRLGLPLAALVLSGCVVTTGPTTSPPQPAPPSAVAPISAQTAARNFNAVVARVEPVAEAECRARAPNANCNFAIVVDQDPRAQPNAYQSLDKSGRPVITFTLSLIADTRNQDELAFVMGHEASHHIRGHIGRQQQTAVVGGVLFGVLATATGLDRGGVDAAQRVGATVGSRVYSKDMELEADALGTVIAAKAGYDPRRGAEYFARIPDPGDRFLGSHPPNAQRQQIVNQVASQM